MLERWGKDDPAILSNSLNVTSNEVERLIQLCNELLHLTREMDIHCEEPTDLNLVVDEVITNFKEVHPEFEFIIKITVTSKIWMRIEHLKQLLIILIDNAIKYSREEEKKIELLYVDQKLMVKDHGIGIEADKLDYIFNRFYRADESRAQNNNNFGLGLAIAKRICSYYDYAITVESIVDQYTIFKENNFICINYNSFSWMY